ncbi:class I SAM-dependent RNA methyltransferase [Mesorhizobium sp. KR9-304]|uniref:class I SAM-dependent RNA methyltransferase n=1 Tax=Mesorhizobium sp. KR9-304 TaxID=3156614 RepID=UPI0032B33AEC
MSAPFEIARLGAQGHGIADTETGPVFIPYTLPGEIITAARVKDRADLIAIRSASPQRVEPPCRHFGVCGGCGIQHLAEPAYLGWKRQKVVQALHAGRIDAEVTDIVPCAPGTRRRVTFSARRSEHGAMLGFNKALSNEIVDIAECPISVPEIVSALDRLRVMAGMISATPQPFHMTVTATDSGLDIAAEGTGKLGEGKRRIVSEFVVRQGFARLSVDGEIVVEPRKPAVLFGDAAVPIPPGAFLQATAFAEQAMAELVVAHFSRAKKVADLFAGCGSFALRLAKQAEVHAVEGDAAALAALDRGFRQTSGLRRVTHERRDLFRRPLTFKELNAFDGLVFDPPRAGAEDQSKQIARSDVPLVAAVSCNPGTLARDLAILVAGGYRVKSVTPIDQFLWSPHVEAVALLEKPRSRR